MKSVYMLVSIGAVLRQGSDTITEWVENVAYIHRHTFIYRDRHTWEHVLLPVGEEKKNLQG